MKRCVPLSVVAGVILAGSGAGCSTSSTPSTGAAAPFVDLGPGDPGPGGIRFAASGEVLALTGYDFPPATDDDPAFVDGWEVKFSHLLVTVDKITISDNPDLSPGDQSQTGAEVGHINGPWAFDLAHGDPSYLPGKGGPGEEAVPFASIKSDSLATDGTRYAFGFDVVAATASAKMVNVTGDATSLYSTMVTDGCAVLYVGTATFKGDKTDADCYPTDRQSWPDVVNFNLCFKSPTTYVNCQNPDNDPATPLGDEEHERGLPLKSDASVIAQVTIHTDHPFWDSVLHDSPAHFDQFAARVVGAAQTMGTTPTVTLEMTKGVDYSAYTDATGKALQWRYCVDPPTDVHPKFTGAMSFDPQSIPRGQGAAGLSDYYDYATYNQSTQGHLNSDGLCFVKRNYPSPP